MRRHCNVVANRNHDDDDDDDDDILSGVIMRLDQLLTIS